MAHKFFYFLIFGFLIFGKTITAQELDTARREVYEYKYKQQKIGDFIPGAAAVTYGFVAINSTWLRKFDYNIYESVNKNHPDFHTSVDDYFRYAPVAAVYALDLMGIKGKHSFVDKTALLFLTASITTVSTKALKDMSNRMRPNRLNDLSFPSGHASTAFAAAEYLHQEYGEKSIWYSVAGYSVASATGVLRVYKNYHWFSDVVAGAGLGVLSTKFAYLVYPSLRKLVLGNRKSNFTLVPVYQDQAYGIGFAGKF